MVPALRALCEGGSDRLQQQEQRFRLLQHRYCRTFANETEVDYGDRICSETK
jgi:hypothetical protein